jgi:hypothetical protein
LISLHNYFITHDIKYFFLNKINQTIHGAKILSKKKQITEKYYFFKIQRDSCPGPCCIKPHAASNPWIQLIHDAVYVVTSRYLSQYCMNCCLGLYWSLISWMMEADYCTMRSNIYMFKNFDKQQNYHKHKYFYNQKFHDFDIHIR